MPSINPNTSYVYVNLAYVAAHMYTSTNFGVNFVRSMLSILTVASWLPRACSTPCFWSKIWYLHLYSFKNRLQGGISAGSLPHLFKSTSLKLPASFSLRSCSSGVSASSLASQLFLALKELKGLGRIVIHVREPWASRLQHRFRLIFRRSLRRPASQRPSNEGLGPMSSCFKGPFTLLIPISPSISSTGLQLSSRAPSRSCTT